MAALALAPIKVAPRRLLSKNSAMQNYLSIHARLVQQRFDATLPALLGPWQQAGGRTYCQKGCAACCTLNVQATLAEAVAIFALLGADHGVDFSRYLEQLARILSQATDFKDFLRRHRRQAGPCPFLSCEGECSIYPLRPLACRALLATRNSAWCGVDFAELHPAEREAFRSSLDPATAFPTHYLAAPQDLARELETEIEQITLTRLGYCLGGNLPLLVYLAGELDLATRPMPTVSEIKSILNHLGLDHPFLVTLAE